MATLTITTTAGTEHTYPGLSLEAAQQEAHAVKAATSQGMWWRSPNANVVEEFYPRSIIRISVDQASV